MEETDVCVSPKLHWFFFHWENNYGLLFYPSVATFSYKNVAWCLLPQLISNISLTPHFLAEQATLVISGSMKPEGCTLA